MQFLFPDRQLKKTKEELQLVRTERNTLKAELEISVSDLAETKTQVESLQKARQELSERLEKMSAELEQLKREAAKRKGPQSSDNYQGILHRSGRRQDKGH
jgi:chromosome segregation ATPase